MGVFEFLNRHRNKILLAGSAVGAVVIINKILAKYEKQWETSSSRGFVHEARRKEIHFENLISESNQICQRMSPKIIAKIQEILDDSKLIEDLSAKRHDKNLQDKVEIWKALKVKILTRLLSEIYCTSILVCYTRVLMSVVGGHVYAKATNTATTNRTGSSSAAVADLTHMKAYSKCYALLGSFYDQKLDCLIHPIEEAVEETLKSYSIDYKISIQDFRVILDKIKRSMSFQLSSPTSKTKVFFFDAEKLSSSLPSICPDSGPLTDEEEQTLRLIFAETQDILESEDFKHVLESGIEIGYAILLDNLLGAFIKMESKLNGEQAQNSNTTMMSNPNMIEVPLVKLLPHIRNNYLKRKETDQKVLVNHLLSLDVLNCFAANVYEAFCIPK